MDSIYIEISTTEYMELIHKSATLDMIVEAWEQHYKPEDLEIDLDKIFTLYYMELKKND